LGRQIKSYKLNKGYNKVILEADQMKKGVYVITMFVDRMIVERKRLLLVN